MNELYEVGGAFIRYLQVASPALDIPMLFFSFMGTVEFYLLLITYIYWLVNPRLGIRVFVVLISTATAISYLKQLLHQPRPYWLGLAVDLSTETSYGVPSGHAASSLAVWGYLAFYLRARWLWVLAGLLALLIALSRLYLGVHFPHDLLGGWLVALLILFAFVRMDPPLSAWINKQTLGMQIGIGAALSLLIPVVGWLVGRIIAASPDPESWAHFAVEARSLADTITVAGALFGAVSGYFLMKQVAPFSVDGSWLRKLGRYILGLVIAMMLLQGLDLLFALLAADETALGYLLRYLRYAAVAFWALFGAPWTFLRFGLAERRF